MSESLTLNEEDALNYLWGGGDEVIECRKVVWVTTRYPQSCNSLLHKGTNTLPAGTRMIRETAKVEGKFGTCYTCSNCLHASMKELEPSK